MPTATIPTGMRLTVPLAAVGLSTAPLIGRDGPVGHVCASFRRSCYVQTPSGEILCIADQSLGHSPLTLSANLPEEIDLRLVGVTEGVQLTVEDHSLRIGPLVLGLQEAVVWTPYRTTRPVDQGTIQLMSQLVASISSQAPSDGLGCLIPHVETLASARYDAVHYHTPLATLAAGAVAELVDGLISDDPRSTQAGVRGLLGLGPGLTPSGDDFLAGLLLALHTDNSAMPASVALPVAANAPAMTGAISISMLNQAARGLGSEHCHQLINALIDGQPQDEVLCRTHALIAVGHTSGWDTLAGILLGLHLIGRSVT